MTQDIGELVARLRAFADRMDRMTVFMGVGGAPYEQNLARDAASALEPLSESMSGTMPQPHELSWQAQLAARAPPNPPISDAEIEAALCADYNWRRSVHGLEPMSCADLRACQEKLGEWDRDKLTMKAALEAARKVRG